MHSNLPKRGRKPLPVDQKKTQRMVTFDNVTALRLAKLGNGNISLGIRRAVEIASQHVALDEQDDYEQRRAERKALYAAELSQ
jgi:hypothetical protein